MRVGRLGPPVEDGGDRDRRVEVAARDVADREDRREQGRGRTRTGRRAASGTVATPAAATDEYPIVRNRNVPTSSARYLRVSMIPPGGEAAGLPAAADLGGLDATGSVQLARVVGLPERADGPPGPAGCRATSGTGPRPVPAGRSRSPGLARPRPLHVAPGGQRPRTVPGRSVNAAAMRAGKVLAARFPERDERQPGDEQDRLRQRRGVRDLAAERQRHRRREVGVGDRAGRPVEPPGRRGGWPGPRSVRLAPLGARPHPREARRSGCRPRSARPCVAPAG